MRVRLRRLAAMLLASALALGSPALSRADPTTIAGQIVVSPLQITLTLSATEASTGQRVHVQGTVANLGAAPVSQVVVELRAATDGLRIRASGVESIARLRPGQRASVSWTVCGRTPGNYILMARANLNGASIDSSARLLTIVAGKDRGCS